MSPAYCGSDDTDQLVVISRSFQDVIVPTIHLCYHNSFAHCYPVSPPFPSKDQQPVGGGGGSYRSQSPHTNGHASPAPSLYHGPSRRASLSSLNDSSAVQDVIHSHPKFVKDISKFWYKPTISRDEGQS